MHMTLIVIKCVPSACSYFHIMVTIVNEKMRVCRVKCVLLNLCLSAPQSRDALNRLAQHVLRDKKRENVVCPQSSVINATHH